MMRILCLGDIAISSNIKSTWPPPAGIVPGDAARILFNWELPIGRIINSIPRTSGPRLLSDPGAVNIIRKWSPGFATLATNHILDAGNEGLFETIDSLNRWGFRTVGAGRTNQEMKLPLIWESAEGCLGILNWVFLETHPDWMVTPGPNCWPGIEEATVTIKELKRKADWVLVVAHWGDEFFPYPSPTERKIAAALAQAGADIIVGHHPHVVRGMEVFGSCMVFYSLGNFYFSDIQDGQWLNHEAPRKREALGVRFSFKRDQKAEYEVLSFWKAKTKIVVDPLSRAVRRLKNVSQPLYKFYGAAYDEWYIAQHKRFDWWEYRLFFAIWNLDSHKITRIINHFLNSRRKKIL